MELDEAIQLLRFNNKHFADLDNKDLLEIAEWLEELKAFRENKWTLIYQKRGYNKAIDDFAGRLKWEYKSTLSLPSIEKETAYFAIDKVAEQLKLKHLEKESED